MAEKAKKVAKRKGFVSKKSSSKIKKALRKTTETKRSSAIEKKKNSFPKRVSSRKKEADEVLAVRSFSSENSGSRDSLKGKPKVAIVSLTSCEGCQFAILDLGERFLKLTEKIDLVDFRLMEDEDDPGGYLDLVLVEGNPITPENEKTLYEARERAFFLVALGNCAAMGGVPEIKNYQSGKNTVKQVYKYIQGISNPEIREIDNFVKVDFVFPGCPIDGEEFLRCFEGLLSACVSRDATKIPQVPDLPVCFECQKKGNKCLLLEKKPCFGPMILGGCDAVCPTSRMGCQGCRGLRPGANIGSMRKTLKPMMSDEEFENATEIYGLRDDLEDRERKENSEK